MNVRLEGAMNKILRKLVTLIPEGIFRSRNCEIFSGIFYLVWSLESGVCLVWSLESGVWSVELKVER